MNVRCLMTNNVRHRRHRLVSDRSPKPNGVVNDIGHLTNHLSECFETSDAGFALPPHDDGFCR